MAFDGVLVHGIAKEMDEKLRDSRLQKIQETGKAEVLLTFKKNGETLRVYLSANPSLPMAALTDETKESLPVAPNFCMVLRKHLSNGRVLRVSTPGLERVLEFEIEHLSELGDYCRLRLILELMGKHSNLLLVNEENEILDAICHVTPLMSSVRTVLPGKPYFLPEVQEKKDLLTETAEGFLAGLRDPDRAVAALSGRYTGISVETASEYLFRAGLSPDLPISERTKAEEEKLVSAFLALQNDILSGSAVYEIAYRGETPVAFAATALDSYRSSGEEYRVERLDSPSLLVRTYYSKRAKETAKKEKTAELRKQLKTVLERTVRKKDLQEKELKDTADREKNRLYGELLSAYSYMLPSGVTPVSVPNYHDDGKPVSIPVDPTLSVARNARRYFERYQKQKRTFEAATARLEETERELEELRSLLLAVDFSENEADLREIREEMEHAGFAKKSSKSKEKKPAKAKPYHYLLSGGFHCYVGKNNLQNEALTFGLATGNDYFFHASKVPGSHVILKTEGREVPDQVFVEAASLAARYSSVASNTLVEVDYVRRKEVKKVPGKRPGFVIYDTHYSMMVSPSESGPTLLDGGREGAI